MKNKEAFHSLESMDKRKLTIMLKEHGLSGCNEAKPNECSFERKTKLNKSSPAIEN